MKVTIERLSKVTWSGFQKYDQSGDFIGPVLSKRTKRPVTGLTKELERELESELQMERGTLRDRSEFWDDFGINMNEPTLTLDLDDAEDRLLHYFALAHPLVANSYNERYASNKYKYVIVNKEDVATENNKKRRLIGEAHAAYNDMNLESMTNTLSVLGRNVNGLSQNQIINALGNIVEKEPERFLSIVEDKLFYIKVTIMKAITLGILRKTPGNIKDATISYEDAVLGAGLNATARILSAPNAQKTYTAIDRMIRANTEVVTDTELDATAASILNELPAGAVGVTEEKPKAAPKKKAPVKRNVGKGVTAVKANGGDSGDFEAPDEL
jgi:hypothetical protein